MKHLFIITVLSFLLPTLVISQSNKKEKKIVNGATAINFYPSVKPFSFYEDYYIQDKSLELRYISSTSGTFTINDGDSLYVEKITEFGIPSQTLGISGSVQFVKDDKLFHEFSLTRLTINKSSHLINYIYTDTLGDQRIAARGYQQKSAAIGLRYELGWYFGKNKKAKVRFGVSGGVEPSFYQFKRTPTTTQEYPVKARFLTVEVALIPMVSAKLSKKLTMDFKVIPNILTADFGKIIEQNPALPKKAQEREREYNLPEINTSLSIVLRYNFKETKR